MNNISIWQRKLVGLTAVGSEFADDAQACFDYVKDFQKSQHEIICHLMKENKELRKENCEIKIIINQK